LKLPEPDRPKLNRAEEAPPRSLLIIPDIHVPVHHERAVDAMLEFATDVKPGMTVQLGDFYDVYGISSFLKHPKRMREKGGTLHEEAQAGRSIWLALLDASDDVRFLPGNHEFRVEREIVCNNPALFEHPALDLRGMFEIPDAVKVYPYDTKLKVGNINISHGHKLRGSLNKYSAANVLANYPNEVNVYGHGHRIDGCERTVYNADRPRYYGAFQIGWLGDYTKAEYTVDPNWQLGFMYVEFWQDDEGRTRFTPHQIRAVDGAFMFAGRRYG
jgi:predicted phosphodiesterase